MREWELPPYKVRQIFTWLQGKGVCSFAEMSDITKGIRQRLQDNFTIYPCKMKKRLVSERDHTVKYLYELWDGELIECVAMQYTYGVSLCVSSQAGCKMGCVFCATGLQGFRRNLKASEMLGQVHAASADLGQRISRVVIMGMGEPLDNFDETVRFIRLLSDENGLHLSMRNITLSTCGLVPQIQRLMEEGLPITLAISLHAPNDTLRSQIMPVNRRWDLQALLRMCEAYFAHTGRRVTFEYALMDGINDSLQCASELAKKLPKACHVNLIPANPVREGKVLRSPREKVAEFAGVLAKKGVHVTVRRTLGEDIDASCGQLRGGT